MKVQVLEGGWRCKQCRTFNYYPAQYCSNCRDPHELSERYELPEDARDITATAGPDPGPNWNCKKCGVSNPGTDDFCAECKEPRSGNDIVNPTHTYVGDDLARGVVLDTPEQRTDNEVAAINEGEDELSDLNDEPIEMPSLTLADEHIPRPSDSPVIDYSGYSEPTNEELAAQDSKLAAFGELLRRLHVPPRVILAVVGGLVILGGLGFGGNAFYVNYIAAEPVVVTVTSTDWERGTEVEEFRTLTQEGWDVPGKGRIIGQRQAVKEYKKVLDYTEIKKRNVPKWEKTGSHSEPYECNVVYKDMGNGRFEKSSDTCHRDVDDYGWVDHEETYEEKHYHDEPVYATWYTYQLDVWETHHFVTARGHYNPYWPPADPIGPGQRAGADGDDDDSYEKYEVTVVDPQGRVSTHKVKDARTFSYLEPGETIDARQTRSGHIRKFEWPES